MKTMTPLKLITFLCLFFFVASIQGQTLKGVLKKKAIKAIDNAAKTLEGKDNKDDNSNDEVQVVNRDENGRSTPSKNFINGNIVFSDNFNNEKHGEFPSKWTQLNGTMQNSQVVALGKKEGVVQFVTSSKMKPTFKNDNYLGNSFKIEIQCYFHGKGNEAYTLNLMNKNDIRGAYSFTIRGDGIVPASSHEYARMPYKLPYPGWRTVQLSFNNGTTKLKYQGNQLINIPILKGYKSKKIKEFTHVELSALSRSGNYGAMINYITIAHGGLPLYKKLMAEGRLIFHDILFDNDSYFIKPSSYPTIDGIVAMLKDNPKTNVTIEGHTDANGSNESNQKLSEYRAKAVMHYITNKGVDAKKLKSVGYGEEKPISLGNNEEAWAKNRRVELVLQR
jgi:outer membrane protein OmpA-like peptidoglycan-associated protein